MHVRFMPRWEHKLTLQGGSGTDAAFAALKTAARVLKGFGLRAFGSHSTNAEYVLTSSIEARLYFAAWIIVDISQGKALLAGSP